VRFVVTPNIVCRGRAGGVSPALGDLARRRGSPFGIFPPNLPPAAKTSRWADMLENRKKEMKR